MKKITLIAMMLTVASVGVYAQGSVDFKNVGGTSQVKYDASVGGGLGGTAVPVGSMKVALYWGVTGSPEGALVAIGPAGINPTFSTGIIAPGLFLGGVLRTGDATLPGTSATFQGRAWSAAFATYEAAIASGNPANFAGKSVVFNSAVGNPTTTPPGLPVNLAPVIPVINVLAVPEPSVIALGVLGLSSLLLFRRRK